MIKKWISLALSCVLFSNCGTEIEKPGSSEYVLVDEARAASPPVSFGDQWYQGKAEITSYTLKQARYGEIHEGQAVMIFVTEDFSKSKQVKLDNPQQAGDDAVKVMKLNATRNFTTGVYPYSTMMSVFTPLERQNGSHPLKVTMSAQEWCGQAFIQMNLNDDQYNVQQFSYFESDGDKSIDIEAAILEDEIWTTIRLNPSDLPTGSIRMIPGTLYQRFSHAPMHIRDATATLSPDPANNSLMVYTIEYPDIERKLEITYTAAFPHEIESWQESGKSGFGRRAQTLTTTAVRKKRMMLDYWTRNSVADVKLRSDLGLD